MYGELEYELLNSPPVYSDKFVEIYQDHLVIHNYYFPTAQKKIIYFSDIASVRTAEELDLYFFSYKGWGMTISNIWWGLDCKRCRFRRYKPFCIVITTKSGCTRKGFSVENSEEAVKWLNKLLPEQRLVPQ